MDGDETRGLEPKRLRPAAPPDGATDAPAASGPTPHAAPATNPAESEPKVEPKPKVEPEPEPEAGPEAKTSAATVVQPAVAAAAPVPAEARPPARRHGFRTRYAHALHRLPTPRAAARGVRSWSHRPSGRLVLPGLLLVAALAATGAAGAFIVPTTGREPIAAPVASPSGSAAFPTGSPGLTTTLPSAPPTIGGPVGPTTAVVQRPADVLKGWAAQLSPRVGVPQVALEAYGYAELVLSRTVPACGLTWTTLAAIGRVESNHGSANSATLLADGRTLPTILGAPLNGTGGTMRIRDTDQGVLDGDLTWDRAVGPMQFIPSTWESQAVDADNDGMRDPNDIDDAALAAANYLCKGGRNLSDVGDWWAAVLTYNDVRPYAQAVYDAANEYGTKSRT